MNKILLQIPNSKMWVGGLNYFINLYEAVYSLPDREIEFIILNENKELPSPLNRCEYVKKPGYRYNLYFLNFLDKIFYKLNKNIFKKDLLADDLYNNKIKVFSHGYPLGNSSKIPSLCWIPDFQHRYLTHYFTSKEIRTRNKHYHYLSRNAYAVLFSSEEALNDFKKFYPDSKCLTYVLHFVALPYKGVTNNTDDVLAKFDISEKFFYVPNQLWAHKNHLIILNALKILKEKDRCPLIISTGYTNDYRNPDFFPAFRKEVIKAGLSERFRFLGLINYKYVAKLLHESICLINPSFFEGWSTSVEEGKSLGKRMLLSDIQVHREQSPERASYFAPDDPESLAELMSKVIDEYDAVVEGEAMEKAKLLLPKRIFEFANKYQLIIKDIINNYSNYIF